MAKDKTENKIVMLQTKVTPEVYARLKAIETQYGFSTFEALRMLVDVIIRFADDKHNLSDDLVRCIRMFENLPGWSQSICLGDGLADMEIVEAFYVLRTHKDPNGCRLVWVERPMMNGDAYGWSATYNVQRMLERFMEVTNTSLYKHLRMLAVEMGTESLFDLVHRLADLYKENPDEVELRLQFEGNDWHKGAQMTDRTRYKRPYTPSEEHLQKTLFDTEDENN